jgi:DnaJ-class molecular chaperone
MLRISKNAPKVTFLFFIFFCLIQANGVQAAGPFEQSCPKCNGTGTIPHNTTVMCPTCQGAGNITAPVTCDKCQGTGNITTTTPCSTCGGTGKVNPTIATVSTSGAETYDGSHDVIRCEITLNNQAGEGTYCTAESVVHLTYGLQGTPGDYVRQSGRVYLAPHTDTKITIDTVDIGFAMTFTYSVYLKSFDQITCPDCKAEGSFSSTTTCDKCNGTGTVMANGVCPDCNGTKTITTLGNLPCQNCNGSGSITNTLNVSLLAGGIIGLIAAGSFGAFMLHKKKK